MVRTLSFYQYGPCPVPRRTSVLCFWFQSVAECNLGYIILMIIAWLANLQIYCPVLPTHWGIWAEVMSIAQVLPVKFFQHDNSRCWLLAAILQAVTTLGSMATKILVLVT